MGALPVSPMLLREVEVEQPVRAPDGRGGWKDAWQPVGTVKAVVAAVSGRERVVAQQVQRTITHRVYVVPGPVRPQPGWRIRFGAGYLTISSVYDPDGSGRIWVCEAEGEPT